MTERSRGLESNEDRGAQADPPSDDPIAADNEVDGLSISIALYFASDPVPLPGFLRGHRGKRTDVHQYFITSHIRDADWLARSRSAEAFLTEHLLTARSQGVSPQWLAFWEGDLQIYLSVHPDARAGDILIAPSLLLLMAEVGAGLRIDSV